MAFLAIITLGLVAGFVASKTVNQTGEGFFLDVILGVTGAFAAGWFVEVLGMEGVTGFNFTSLVVAGGGATVLLVLYHRVYLSMR